MCVPLFQISVVVNLVIANTPGAGEAYNYIGIFLIWFGLPKIIIVISLLGEFVKRYARVLCQFPTL